jgi:phage shock protein A
MHTSHTHATLVTCTKAKALGVDQAKAEAAKAAAAAADATAGATSSFSTSGSSGSSKPAPPSISHEQLQRIKEYMEGGEAMQQVQALRTHVHIAFPLIQQFTRQQARVAEVEATHQVFSHLRACSKGVLHADLAFRGAREDNDEVESELWVLRCQYETEVGVDVSSHHTTFNSAFASDAIF